MRPPDLGGALGRSARRFTPDDLGRTIPVREPVATAREGALGLAWSREGGQSTGTPRVLVASAGRIAGLERVATELAIPACAPEEVLARGYEAWGEGLLPRLRGAFSLVLWDRLRGSGLLVRDQLGAVPVFLHTGSGELLFASEVRVLLALLSATPSPDDVAVVHRLAGSRGPSDRTLYRGITRLPPGHLVRLDGERWQLGRWWAPSYRVPVDRPRPRLVAELRSEMRDAVARRVGGDAPVGIMLSGGFDSAAVAAAAPVVPRAYSAVFPRHPLADESEAIALTRHALGLSGVEVALRGGSALAGALEFLDEWLVPPASPNWFLWAPVMRRAAADGMVSLLDGEGGDELFGASPALLADMLSCGRVAAAVHMARRIPGMGTQPRARWIARALQHYGVRGALPRGLHLLLRRARASERPRAQRLRPDAARLQRDTEHVWAWKDLDGPRWWAALADSLTAGSDALGGAEHLRREGTLAGVQLQHPWRDLDLVEFMLGVPPAASFDPELDRPLAREAMRAELPHQSRPRLDKAYFDALLVDALSGVDACGVRALLTGPGVEVTRYASPSAVRELRDGGGERSAKSLWELAVMDIWLRRQAGTPLPPLPPKRARADFHDL